MKKNTAKALLAALLVLSMTASLCACGAQSARMPEAQEPSPAPAATQPAAQPSPAPADQPAAAAFDRASAEECAFKKTGVTLYLPPEYQETTGLYSISADNDVLGPGTYFVQCDYCGFTEEWLNSAIHVEEMKPEDMQKYMQSMVPIFALVGVDKNRGAEDIVASYKELAGDSPFAASDLVEVKKVGDITYFKLEKDFTGNRQNLEPEFGAEYDKLFALNDLIIENADFYQPVASYADVTGNLISFETTDLDGNVVKSEELFAKYDVTMVNVWATWCSACLSELSELEEINGRLAGKKCAIVGFLGDGDEDDTVALAKKQLAEAGCTYLNLRPFEGWEQVLVIDVGWPTSFFVGSDGKIVAPSIAGAAVERYEKRIDDILAGSGIDDGADVVENGTENSANAYRIFVVDQSSKPVVGAMVQFCTEDTCKIGKTDDKGMASFDDPEGAYQVHILKVPKGYKPNEELYTTPDTYSDMTVVVETE